MSLEDLNQVSDKDCSYSSCFMQFEEEIVSMRNSNDSKDNETNDNAENNHYQAILREFNSMESSQLVENYSQCNKSNYVKNILNQFGDYINFSGDQIVIESISETTERNLAQIRKEFNCFIKYKSLNQGLLISILKSKRFSAQFLYFLNYYAEEWVMRNHLKNSRLHILCIAFMKRCYEEPELIENIKKYKKKN